MFKKKIILFIILFSLIFSIGIVSATNNNSYTNTNFTSNNFKTFNDIQTQIDNANENDTIELHGEYFSSRKYIKISKTITIQGKDNNTILNGNNTSGIFQITSKGAHLNLKNLKIIKSNTMLQIVKHEDYIDIYEKSAIYGKYGANININNCTFENNIGQLVSESDLTCTNTNFINNTHLESIEDYIENHLISAENINFYNCNFLNNFIQDKLIRGDSLNVTKCTFINKNINRKCNATLLFGSNVNKISESKFINNNAQPIFLVGYENTIYNSTFINNTMGISLLGNNEIINSRFENNTGEISLDIFIDDWEPWYTYKYNSKICNCSFISNTAKNGAISASTNLEVKDSLFENNTGEFAGAITIHEVFEQNYISKAKIINSIFKNNKQSTIVTNDMHAKLEIIIGNTTKKYESSVILNDLLNKMQIIKVSTSKVNTVYYSETKLTVKLINIYTKNPVKNSKITLKVYFGSKYKNFHIYTNTKGIATFQTSNLNFGFHKVEITSNFGVCPIPKTYTSIKISKAKTKIIAHKLISKYKKTKYFKLIITHKTTKKVVKNTYVKIKIDKKTYKIKTNSKGIAKFNTKKLKIGKHKVVISSGNSNYIMSTKSTIIIKK